MVCMGLFCGISIPWQSLLQECVLVLIPYILSVLVTVQIRWGRSSCNLLNEILAKAALMKSICTCRLSTEVTMKLNEL